MLNYKEKLIKLQALKNMLENFDYCEGLLVM